ncbi:ABC-type nitrate/sulfonate/bicarbonate transport system, substrate-binding protein [Beijerinckia sp. 28-YEA-48]|nr:ABC-type nitrate/sulfonate/bicarbonate transport system, substrate-binding protein [Beijerinckia sp. 28-YEA-48]
MKYGASIALGLIFAFSQTIPVYAQPKPSLKTVVRATVSTTAVEWPDIIAKDKGFYEKEGLNVEHIMTSPTTITPSLIGGTTQFGFINASQLVLAIEGGADLVAIGQGADPSPYSLMALSSIKSVNDLKGKTISLAEPGDVYAEATRDILRKAGLDPAKDVIFRYGGNSNQRMAAIMAGAVDAVPVVPPQDRMLIDRGFNAIAFYPDYYPRLALSLTAVRRPWAQQNPELVKAFLRAQAAAIQWLYDPANKKEALELLAKETRSDVVAAEHGYNVYVTKLRMFPENGCIQAPGMEVLMQVLSRVNKNVKADQPVNKYIDTQWCP